MSLLTRMINRRPRVCVHGDDSKVDSTKVRWFGALNPAWFFFFSVQGILTVEFQEISRKNISQDSVSAHIADTSPLGLLKYRTTVYLSENTP